MMIGDRYVISSSVCNEKSGLKCNKSSGDNIVHMSFIYTTEILLCDKY